LNCHVLSLTDGAVSDNKRLVNVLVHVVNARGKFRKENVDQLLVGVLHVETRVVHLKLMPIPMAQQQLSEHKGVKPYWAALASFKLLNFGDHAILIDI